MNVVLDLAGVHGADDASLLLLQIVVAAEGGTLVVLRPAANG